MNHTAMNNSIWTTNSQSLSDFEFSHFCRYFPFLFDSCGHILLSSVIWMVSVIRYIHLHLLYCKMILRTAEKHSLDCHTILGHYPVLLSRITLHSNNQHQQSPAIICKQVLNSSDENSENILYNNRN